MQQSTAWNLISTQCTAVEKSYWVGAEVKLSLEQSIACKCCLEPHLKQHSGEISSECNQCDQASELRTYLKTHRHSREKSLV